MTGLSCLCEVEPIGYTPRAGLFVCVNCEKIHKPHHPVRGGFEDVANIFRGGPLDGDAYTTEVLTDPSFDFLTNPGYILYHATNELVISESTGAKARVWEFRETPFAPRKNNTPSRKKRIMSDDTATATETTVEKAPAVDPAVTTALLERRKSLKLSRKTVSDHSGLSQAKIARIEQGGARTNQSEVDELEKAINELTPAPSAESDSAEG